MWGPGEKGHGDAETRGHGDSRASEPGDARGLKDVINKHHLTFALNL